MTPPVLIPQNDPRAGYLAHRAELDDAWRRVMEGGRYILGNEVTAFEREFATYLEVPFAISTANGTDALHLSLRSLDIGTGDRVLTVSHTAVATVASIVLAGAEPVFVDIDRATFTMDPNRLEDAIRRERTAPDRHTKLKAIVPVHLYGLPADMQSVLEIARRHELAVIEDCAQAHGASLSGRKVGTWGTLAAFSFYPTKNLGAFGDGGMIVTRDESLAVRCRRLREYGWNDQRVSTEPGVNSRLDELQAAILRVKLRHLDADNAARTTVANIYNRLLTSDHLLIPAIRTSATHVFHQYVIRSRSRDSMKAFLRTQGIETSIHYPLAVHQHPAYARFNESGFSLWESEQAAAEVLSLPMYPQQPHASAEKTAQAIAGWAGSEPSQANVLTA